VKWDNLPKTRQRKFRRLSRSSVSAGEAVLAMVGLRAIGLLGSHGCCTFYEKSRLGACFFASTRRRF
jgi:hypothetical protein